MLQLELPSVCSANYPLSALLLLMIALRDVMLSSSPGLLVYLSEHLYQTVM